MRHQSVLRSVPRAALLLACLLQAPSAQAQATFEPWIYHSVSDDPQSQEPVMDRLVWQRHRFFEENTNTVFMLAWELYNPPGQPAVHRRSELLEFNHAHFVPPAGVDAGSEGRRVARPSIEAKGLRAHLNYSKVPIHNDPMSDTPRFSEGTFFISKTWNGHLVGDQIPDGIHRLIVGENTLEDLTFSATRAAFGRLDDDTYGLATIPSLITRIDETHGDQTVDPEDATALYVTAGLGYGPEELEDDSTYLAGVMRDRLFVRDDDEWTRAEDLVPSEMTDGNSSGVAFGDFDGDGFMDLYVGKYGSSFAGAQNELAFWDDTNEEFDRVTTTSLPSIVDATHDVATADLDLDGDLDLVVANRVPWTATDTGQSDDYALRNDGAGGFTAVVLDDNGTDTTSIAIGNLDGTWDAASYPEIVLGNAGTLGYDEELQPPHEGLSDSHRLQIQRLDTLVNIGGSLQINTYVDRRLNFGINNPLEQAITSPATQQVLLVDLLGDEVEPYRQDDYLDLVIVNHRDRLKTFDLSSTYDYVPGGNLFVLQNDGGTGFVVDELASIYKPTASSKAYVRCAVFGNFLWSTEEAGENLPTLDLFLGCGNRFTGAQNVFHRNVAGDDSNGLAPWAATWVIHKQTYDILPGVEKGYGFDFADVDDNGLIDAIAMARSYDYYVRDIGRDDEIVPWHLDLTSRDLSVELLDNRRSNLKPRGLEDATIADFDGDGELDALGAGQIHWSQGVDLPEDQAAESMVLLFEDPTSADGPFAHEVQSWQLKDEFGASTSEPAVHDVEIDIDDRDSEYRALIGDRAVSGDLDGDGDVDAIVRLFQMTKPSEVFLNSKAYPLDDAHWDSVPEDEMLAGWRYLRNTGSSPVFEELTLDLMSKPSGSSPGDFSPLWNRGPGMDLLADFDNNGHLDYLSTYSRVTSTASNGLIVDVEQGRDLLFMGGLVEDQSQTVFGHLVEVHDEWFDQSGGLPVLPQLAEALGNRPMSGSFFASQGDVDNDGDADLFITHTAQGGTTNYPSLMINYAESTATPDSAWATTHFEDEFLTRVDLDSFDDSPIESPLQTHQSVDYEHMDASWSGGFIDYDGDGDLDIIYAVNNDMPRVLENLGWDRNANGVINASDGSPLGTFEDVTADVLPWHRVLTDANDFQVVDLDGNGTLDFAMYPFDDEITLFRNTRSLGDEPAVTDIWPRVGSIHSTSTDTAVITLIGTHLDTVDLVQLIFAGTTVNLSGSALHAVDTNKRWKREVELPVSCPVGLAQVRVRRVVTSTEPPYTQTNVWSRQYAQYFVLEPAS